MHWSVDLLRGARIGSGFAALLFKILFGVSTEVVGVFGEDPGNETDMKELRDEEPNLEANILNKQDATERDDDNEEEDQKPADYDV